MARRFSGKKRLAIKNVRNAISVTFDGQTIFGKKASCHQKRSEPDFGDDFREKSVLPSKTFGTRFRTLLMARRFLEKKASCHQKRSEREFGHF